MPRFPLPVAPPEPVAASHLLHPIIWPNGRTILPHRNQPPLQCQRHGVRSNAADKSLTLAEAGRLGEAVAYDDPFSTAFAVAADLLASRSSQSRSAYRLAGIHQRSGLIVTCAELS